MKRIWTYSRTSWDGWHPMLGHDEYGHRTFLLTVPGLGAVVFRLWTCRDPECVEDTRDEAAFILSVQDDPEFNYGPEAIAWARERVSA